MQRLADLLDRAAGDKRGALRIALQALAENPTDEWAIATSRRLAAESGGWPELVEAYEAALPRVRRRAAAALALLSTLAAAYEGELANPEPAIARNQKILRDLRPRTPTRSRRSSASTSRPAASPICSRSTTRSSALAKSKAEQLEIRFKLASLYEEEIKQPDKAIELYSAILAAGSRRSCRRWRPSIACTSSSAAGRSWRRRSSKEIDLSTDMAAIAELKFRRGAVHEQYLEDGAGAVASYREALELDPSHVGARTALQAYLSNSDGELQRAAVKVLEPIYEANNDLARLVEVQRIKLAHEKKTDKRVDLLLRIGKLEGQLGQHRPGVGGVHARVRARSRRRTPAREALENLANILDNWQPLVALYEKALSAKGKERLPSALERELLLVVAVAYDEKLGQSERAVEYFRRAQSIQPEDASALVALERLYTRTERWSDLVDTLLKKAQLVTDAAEREEIRIRIARSGRRCSATPSRRSSPGTTCCRTTPATCRRCARSIACTCARRVPRAGRQPAAAAEAGRRRSRPRRCCCSGAWARCASSTSGSWAAPSTPTRKILQLEPEHRETIAALERILPNPEHELDVARCSSRSTRSAATGRSLIGVLRGRGAPHRRSASAKIALCKQIAEGYEIGLDDPAQRLRGARARAGRGSAEPGGAGEHRAAGARAAASWTIWSPATGAWSASVADPRAQERALSQDRAPGRGRSWATTRRRRPRTWRRWTCGRATSTRPTRSSSSTCARADYQQPGEAAAAQGGDRRGRRREEDAVLPRGAAPRGGARGPRERRSPCSSTCCPSTTATRPRSISSSGCTSGSRAGTTSRTSTPRRRSSPPTRSRRSRCCSCSGRSTTASSAIPERAIETYSVDHGPRSRGLRRGAGARSPVRPDRALVRPARRARAADRAGAVAGRGGVAALPHRRAVARAPEGPGARGRGLPPGAGDGPGARADRSARWRR